MPKGGPYYIKKPGVVCKRCKQPIPVAAEYTWDREYGGVIHPACKGTAPVKDTAPITIPQPVETQPVIDSAPVEIQPVVSSNGNGKPIGQTLAEEIGPYLKSGVDAADVQSMVDAAVAAHIEKPIVIRMPGQPDITLPPTAHEKLKTVLYHVNMGRNVYLPGPSQGGKSTAAKMVADALGRPYYYISLNPQSPDSRLMGFIRPDGTYQATDFYRAYKDGGVFNIDEVDNASGSLLTTLNSALANGHASFPCGMVERHPDFVCIATGNTVGLGGTQDYQERRNLDGAFRQRFAFVDWPYSEQVEDAMTRPYCPSKADKILTWVRDVRKAAKVRKVHGILATPASAQRMAQDIEAGFLTPAEAAYAHVWKGVDETTAQALGCGLYPEGLEGGHHA